MSRSRALHVNDRSIRFTWTSGAVRAEVRNSVGAVIWEDTVERPPRYPTLAEYSEAELRDLWKRADGTEF
jgi:hypothetical protein